MPLRLSARRAPGTQGDGGRFIKDGTDQIRGPPWLWAATSQGCGVAQGGQSIASYRFGNPARSSLPFQAIGVKNKLSEPRLAMGRLALGVSACDETAEERQRGPTSSAALPCRRKHPLLVSQAFQNLEGLRLVRTTRVLDAEYFSLQLQRKGIEESKIAAPPPLPCPPPPPPYTSDPCAFSAPRPSRSQAGAAGRHILGTRANSPPSLGPQPTFFFAPSYTRKEIFLAIKLENRRVRNGKGSALCVLSQIREKSRWEGKQRGKGRQPCLNNWGCSRFISPQG